MLTSGRRSGTRLLDNPPRYGRFVHFLGYALTKEPVLRDVAEPHELTRRVVRLEDIDDLAQAWCLAAGREFLADAEPWFLCHFFILLILLATLIAHSSVW